MDGAEVDGSLKAVGGTHGVSPYRSYGFLLCVLFYRSGRESRYPGSGIALEINLLLLCASLPLVCAPLAMLREKSAPHNPLPSRRRFCVPWGKCSILFDLPNLPNK